MLSRGTYGIEYDEDRNRPSLKYWWLVVLVPLFALVVIFVRGCKDRPSAEDPMQAARFDTPETQVNRETASVSRHFLGKWFGAPAPDTRAPAASEQDTALTIPKTSKRIPEQIKKLIDQATADEQANNLADARLSFLYLLGQKEAEELLPFLERKAGHINTALFLSKQPASGKTTYTVVRGDTLGRIAQRFGCPQEFILEINGIGRPELLKLGAQLHVLDNPKFELQLSKAEASALLTLNGEFFKRYALVSGDAHLPPAGNYTVRNRGKRTLDHAEIWTGLPDDKPRRPQDICWLILSDNITLHGTRHAAATDAPAIRFRNADIDELYLLLPNATPVTITDE